MAQLVDIIGVVAIQALAGSFAGGAVNGQIAVVEPVALVAVVGSGHALLAVVLAFSAGWL